MTVSVPGRCKTEVSESESDGPGSPDSSTANTPDPSTANPSEFPSLSNSRGVRKKEKRMERVRKWRCERAATREKRRADSDAIDCAILEARTSMHTYDATTATTTAITLPKESVSNTIVLGATNMTTNAPPLHQQ